MDLTNEFQVYEDKVGQYRFRLVAANGEIISYGEAYMTKEAVLNVIASIKANAASARVRDLT